MRTPSLWQRWAIVVVVAVAAFAVLGVLGALVWQGVTTTAGYQVLPQGVVSGEDALSASFNPEVSFLVIGLLGGLIGGVGVTWAFRRQGPVVLVGVVLGSALACYLMYTLGIRWGPAPLHEQARGAAEGAVLYAPLAVHATGVLFAWPVAAVAGLLGTVSLVTEDEQNHGQ